MLAKWIVVNSGSTTAGQPSLNADEGKQEPKSCFIEWSLVDLSQVLQSTV
jgi:hypothetical protein